jgi:hypothetical protein
VLQALLEALYNIVLVISIQTSSLPVFDIILILLFSYAQDYAFSDIFGAPTAADVTPNDQASNTVAGRLGRRVSGLARRASAAVLSATGPIITSRPSLGASAGSTILSRVIPEAVESNRALAGISMSNVGTLGTRQSSFGVDVSDRGVYGHRQSSMDIESGVSSSNRSSTIMQRRHGTLSSTGSVSIFPTSRRSQVMSLAPSHDLADESPFPAEAEFDQDPVQMYGQLENNLQRFLSTLESDADRSLLVEQWGYASCLFY